LVTNIELLTAFLAYRGKLRAIKLGVFNLAIRWHWRILYNFSQKLQPFFLGFQTVGQDFEKFRKLNH